MTRVCAADIDVVLVACFRAPSGRRHNPKRRKLKTLAEPPALCQKALDWRQLPTLGVAVKRAATNGCEEPRAQDCDPLEGAGCVSDTDDEGSLDDFKEAHHMDLRWMFDAEGDAIVGVSEATHVSDESLHQVMPHGSVDAAPTGDIFATTWVHSVNQQWKEHRSVNPYQHRHFTASNWSTTSTRPSKRSNCTTPESMGTNLPSTQSRTSKSQHGKEATKHTPAEYGYKNKHHNMNKNSPHQT